MEIHEIHKIFFVTKVIHQRVQIFALNQRYPLIVIDNLKFYRRKFGFLLCGFVIMPEHYHLVIDTLGKNSISKIKEDMNKYVSREIVQALKMYHPKVIDRLRIDSAERRGHRRHEYRVFQKGRYDFEIVTPKKLLEKLEYIHNNPLRAGLVDKPEDYLFSSARNYVLGDDSLIKLDPLPI
jgi:putative transposase